MPSVIEALRQGGIEATPSPTSGRGDATRIARAAADDGGVDVIFALGGDGTLREAACGLLGRTTPLGFLPSGTVNVMAAALGIPTDARAAAAGAARLTPRPFDVGRCGGIPFLMMASAGIDAAVMAEQNPALKRWLGRNAFGLRAASQFWRYPRAEIRVSFGDGTSVSATWVVVANIPYYGGRFRIAPDADPADGVFDIVMLTSRSRAAMIGFAGDLVRGAHVRRPDVVVRRASALTLEAAGDVPLQIDGDAARVTMPLDLAIEPSAVVLLAA